MGTWAMDELPSNFGAEQATLGSLLIDRDAVAQVADWLPAEAFFDQRNERVYRSLLWLWNKRVPADLVTLTSELDRVGRLDAVGGMAYLSELMTVVPSAVHLTYYADLVMEAARRRAVAEAAADVVRQAYAGTVEVEDVVGAMRRAVEPFAPPSDGERVLLAEAIPAQMQTTQDRWDGLIRERVTPTGIASLDRSLWGGLRDEDLAVVAAMSGMGKTSLMLQIAQAAAERTGKVSVVVSLEMRAEAIRNRLIAAEAGVGYGVAYDTIGDLGKRALWMRAAERLQHLPLAVLTEPRTTDRIRGELERLSTEHDIGLVLIDHLDLLADEFRSDGEETRVAKLTQRCKAIGQQVKVPVVVLAQLNRAVDAKAPFLPEPRHIRGSGRIREICDVLLMPYRRRAYVELQMLEADNQADYLPFPRGNEQRVDLFLFKNRNGELGMMPLGFDPMAMAFRDASETRVAA
jgi:replicative DNA helicase